MDKGQVQCPAKIQPWRVMRLQWQVQKRIGGWPLWGVFLLSLKSLLETGKGAPWPNDIKLDSWE